MREVVVGELDGVPLVVQVPSLSEYVATLRTQPGY